MRTKGVPGVLITQKTLRVLGAPCGELGSRLNARTEGSASTTVYSVSGDLCQELGAEAHTHIS